MRPTLTIRGVNGLMSVCSKYCHGPACVHWLKYCPPYPSAGEFCPDRTNPCIKGRTFRPCLHTELSTSVSAQPSHISRYSGPSSLTINAVRTEQTPQRVFLFASTSPIGAVTTALTLSYIHPVWLVSVSSSAAKHSSLNKSISTTHFQAYGYVQTQLQPRYLNSSFLNVFPFPIPLFFFQIEMSTSGNLSVGYQSSLQQAKQYIELTRAKEMKTILKFHYKLQV